jgi:hypothetical protein
MRTARASYRPLSRALVNITILVVVLSAISASAQPKSNPYRVIAFRNAFGLKPPAVPKSTTPEPPPRVMPNLALSGIVDFYRVRCALVTRTDPGRPPKNYTLDLGELEGGLKLINLDAKSATATVQVDGADTLTLKLGSNSLSKPSPAPQIPGFRRPFQMPMINR